VIEKAVFAGAVHVSPPDLFRSLADALTGAPLDAAEVRLIRRLRTEAGQTPGFGPDELSLLLRLALGRRSEQALGLSNWQANRLMVHRVTGNETARQILDRATVMLVPYCAKPAWCRWRHEDGCPECGACEVGEAYRLARERGLEVVTITQYEHLCDVLEQMRARGVPAYVGMCCRHFYLKRIHAFRHAGMPAVLMDISGSNCYELGQEDEAYEGRFTAEAQLDGELLEKVMVWVPKLPDSS
jgi:lipoate-protein ligase A